jgi:microcystin-dependent protein
LETDALPRRRHDRFTELVHTLARRQVRLDRDNLRALDRDFAGESVLFGAPADGQTCPIENNTALFSILGTDFGGDGTSNFELPNLRGIETIGAGHGVGLPFVDLGQTLGQTSYDLTTAQLPPSLGGTSANIDQQQPSLGLNYVINAFGVSA